MAAQNGHVEIVKLLVEEGAVVDQPDDDGSIALAQASLKGHLSFLSISSSS
jgi:ankyrin repeat protein